MIALLILILGVLFGILMVLVYAVSLLEEINDSAHFSAKAHGKSF